MFAPGRMLEGVAVARAAAMQSTTISYLVRLRGVTSPLPSKSSSGSATCCHHTFCCAAEGKWSRLKMGTLGWGEWGGGRKEPRLCMLTRTLHVCRRGFRWPLGVYCHPPRIRFWLQAWWGGQSGRSSVRDFLSCYHCLPAQRVPSFLLPSSPFFFFLLFLLPLSFFLSVCLSVSLSPSVSSTLNKT